MSSPDLLAQLRPVMTHDEVGALLGPAVAKKALDAFSGFEREAGVSIQFDHREGMIDSSKPVMRCSLACARRDCGPVE